MIGEEPFGGEDDGGRDAVPRKESKAGAHEGSIAGAGRRCYCHNVGVRFGEMVEMVGSISVEREWKEGGKEGKKDKENDGNQSLELVGTTGVSGDIGFDNRWSYRADDVWNCKE